MPRKKKLHVWHKRKGKFIPSHVLRAHVSKKEEETDSQEPLDLKKRKLKKFAKSFSQQIKRAVREDLP